jgi:hypothetical protein
LPGKNCSASAKIGRGSNSAKPSNAMAFIPLVAHQAGMAWAAAPAITAEIEKAKEIERTVEPMRKSA